MSRAHGLSCIKRSSQSGFVYGLSPFAATVLTRPHGWFVEGFTVKSSRITTVHFACLWSYNGLTVVKSNYGRGERKQRLYGSLDGRHFRALTYAFVLNGYGNDSCYFAA